MVISVHLACEVAFELGQKARLAKHDERCWTPELHVGLGGGQWHEHALFPGNKNPTYLPAGELTLHRITFWKCHQIWGQLTSEVGYPKKQMSV